MARKSQDLKRIEMRRDEIADRIKAHETELARLRSEYDELGTAQRVLERFASTGTVREVEHSVLDEIATEIENLTPQIPSTIGEMALELLKERGNEGATSNELLEAIRGRWMPDLVRTSLSPPLSRLRSKGVIDQDDDHWKIVAGNEGADEEI